MPRRDEQGFTIIGLLVVVAVLNIGLAVATTSWITIDQRAKEAELIWRGQQYLRALRCHQQETGALPDELDELLDSDCARALYPDPMTSEGRWRVIRQGDLDLDLAPDPGAAAAARLDGIDRELRGPEAFAEPFRAARPAAEARTGRSFGGGRSLGGRRGGAFGSRGSLGGDRSFGGDPGSRRPSAAGFGQVGGGNGIVGVASTSTRQSLRVYDGETSYDGWRFVLR